MKKSISFAILNTLFIYLLLILLLLSGCSGKMSVEEARQVTVSMGDKSLIVPPRRIDDILSVLDQYAQDDQTMRQQVQSELEKPPPQTVSPASLSNYYYQRGDALMKVGRYSQALNDLRKALAYASQSGGPGPKLLFRLAYAEFVSGNFQHAIELMEQSLLADEAPRTYKGLVKFYARVGDLESAQRAAIRGINLCNRLRNNRGWGSWPVIHADHMKAMLLEAQGKFAEAEAYYRQILRNWSLSMRQRYPLAYIVPKIYLARNLKNQDRLIEAEIQARESLKILGGLDRESEVFGSAVGELGDILLRQGRLQDAGKLIRAGVRIMQEANVSSDSYVMGDGRMRLGEVLTADQNFDEAMQQFDLARFGMQQNQYLYENFLARNPALMLALVRTERIQEANQRISAVLAQNRKLLGEKHYLTAETLGIQGMLYVLQKNNQKAIQNFSAALPILIEKSRAQTFSYDRKMRLRIILETYMDVLSKVRGTGLEKNTGIESVAEAFKLADFLSGSTVR